MGTSADVGGKADNTSSTQSTPELIQDNNAFYWADSDYASFDASENSLQNSAHATPLDPMHALTQILQAHVDRIDAVVRADVLKTYGADLVAPHPIVKVLPSSSTFNAWVSPVLVCSGSLENGATAAMPIGGTPRTLLQKAQVTGEAPYACVRPTWPGSSDLNQFWDRVKPSCSLSSDLTPSGTSCSIYDSTPGEISIISTSPYINITSDLIAAASDEKLLVVVLSHELGHYYRSHVSDARLQKYDFWYETEADRKKTPVPSANAQALEQLYTEVVNAPKPLQSVVVGQYSPRLRNFLLTGIAPLLSERTEPGFVCAAARDALGVWAQYLSFGYGIPSAAMSTYLDFESKLVACAPKLNLTGTPGADAISYGSVLMAALHSGPHGVTLPWDGTLSDILTTLNTRALHFDQVAAQLTKALSDNRIGLYTIEQEADNIALLISTRLGITPDQVLNSWLEFMSAIEATIPPAYMPYYIQSEGGYDRAACQSLLASGFTTTDTSGKQVPLFMPLGTLDDPHHSSCYRLFNFWREQKLQNYQVTTPIADLSADWPSLQAAAKQISQDAAVAGF